MATPNENFKLTVQDVEHIENALRLRMTLAESQETKREITELLGKIHNQKMWYRPAKETYVSG